MSQHFNRPFPCWIFSSDNQLQFRRSPAGFLQSLEETVRRPALMLTGVANLQKSVGGTPSSTAFAHFVGSYKNPRKIEWQICGRFPADDERGAGTVLDLRPGAAERRVAARQCLCQ
jgi:hypothetical protein